MDCTDTMKKWIDVTKTHIYEIVQSTKAHYPNKEIEVGFLGYRDFIDKGNQFEIFTFTNDISQMIEFLD